VSAAFAVNTPENEKSTGVINRATATVVLLTTMREILAGDVVTAGTAIDTLKVAEPPLFAAVIM